MQAKTKLMVWSEADGLDMRNLVQRAVSQTAQRASDGNSMVLNDETRGNTLSSESD